MCDVVRKFKFVILVFGIDGLSVMGAMEGKLITQCSMLECDRCGERREDGEGELRMAFFVLYHNVCVKEWFLCDSLCFLWLLGRCGFFTHSQYICGGRIGDGVVRYIASVLSVILTCEGIVETPVTFCTLSLVSPLLTFFSSLLSDAREPLIILIWLSF